MGQWSKSGGPGYRDVVSVGGGSESAAAVSGPAGAGPSKGDKITGQGTLGVYTVC